jgi:hypothetical protein
VTKFAVWIALVGISALGSSAAHAQSLTLTSSDIKEGGTIANEQVFKGFGCTGDNLSPALSWSGAPSGTKSFAVTRSEQAVPHHRDCYERDEVRTQQNRGEAGRADPVRAAQRRFGGA